MTTLAEIGNIRGNSNAVTRWAKFGPYYAMFPIDFAFDVVSKYSKKGDYIIDPFAGRFSSVYAGGVFELFLSLSDLILFFRKASLLDLFQCRCCAVPKRHPPC